MQNARNGQPAPTAVGVGFKPQHEVELSRSTQIDWVEVHAENYFVDGGPRLRMLERVRALFPLSIHGVGLSLAGAEPIDPTSITRLKELVDRFEPFLVSEHLAWSAHGGRWANDLLPIAYSEKSLAHATANVDRLQQALGRSVLIENPSLYLVPRGQSMTETEFLAALVERTGCGILLDLNNVIVSAANLGYDPYGYIDAIDAGLVAEIHLAGHKIEEFEGRPIRIDNHGSCIGEQTMQLYEQWLGRAAAPPTLIEWDTDLPAFSALEAEVARIRQSREKYLQPHAA